jgi:CheY-like chemotaxis protein
VTSVLLIDELPMTRNLMADLLRQEGYEVDAVAGLPELTRQSRPDICLVELVRQRGNGFSLAASLCNRWSSDPPRVVLLSDREQASDHHWAIARGVAGVINRVHGWRSMLRQLGDLMAGQVEVRPLRPDAAEPDNAVETDGPGPAQQLARQICSNLRHSLDQARQLSASDIEGQSRWLAKFSEAFNAIENALTFLPPDAGQFAVALDPASAQKSLALLLGLYQAVSREVGDCLDDPLVQPQVRCKARLRVLQAGRSDTTLDEIIRMGCGLHALHLPQTDGFNAQSVWAWLWQSARLRHCRELRVSHEWRKLRRLSAETTVTDCEPEPDRDAAYATELEPALGRCCRKRTVNYADFYQLLVWLRLQPGSLETLRVATGSLAKSVILPTQTGRADMNELHALLKGMLESGVYSSEKLVYLLRRQSLSPLLSISTAQQTILAAQLSLLPRPQEFMLTLTGQLEQHDLVCNEIRHELAALNEVANALKLSAIESVSLVLMQIYSVFAINPFITDMPAVMSQLRRAHLCLCLLLDQAAAWQPVSRAGLLTERLYRLLDRLLSLGKSVADEPGLYQSAGCAGPASADWHKCHQINRRLRQLLAGAEPSDSLRAALSELLRTQNHLMQRMPAYRDQP